MSVDIVRMQGALAGLPAFSIAPPLDVAVLQPYIPPLLHALLTYSDPGDDTVWLQALRDCKRLGLCVTVEAFESVDPWMLEASRIVLYTQHLRVIDPATEIVFMTEDPPVGFRPAPVHLATAPILWWHKPKASLSEIASLPTGMRLWFPLHPARVAP